MSERLVTAEDAGRVAKGLSVVTPPIAVCWVIGLRGDSCRWRSRRSDVGGRCAGSHAPTGWLRGRLGRRRDSARALADR